MHPPPRVARAGVSAAGDLGLTGAMVSFLVADVVVEEAAGGSGSRLLRRGDEVRFKVRNGRYCRILLL